MYELNFDLSKIDFSPSSSKLSSLYLRLISKACNLSDFFKYYYKKALSKLKELSDEQLMSLVANGHLKIMHELFERYNRRVYNYCLKLTNNRVASEDITQETFYKLIKYRESFKEKHFGAWIFTITRNLCIDFLKKEKKTQLSVGDVEVPLHDQSYYDLEKQERLDQLQKALNKLDRIDKELIVLSRYEKLMYKDIAQILDMSESAIKTRIHRALKKLRIHYFNSDRDEK